MIRIIGEWPWWKRLALVLPVALLAFAWIFGEAFTHPANRPIGSIPPDLPAQNVTFPSNSGRPLHGWFVPGVPGRGAVILFPGLRDDRRALLNRGRLLWNHGYSILLFDFQATGESPGERISFGYFERLDAQAATQWLRQRLPGEKIGGIGVSLGGAAALLADLDLDAWVLEMVYPSIDLAIGNRLARFLGPIGWGLSPLLTYQCRYRFGVGPEALRPIDHIARIRSPKLLIAGSIDLHTPLAESRALLNAATGPKELWVVEGAKHVDFCNFSPAAYRQRVLAFFERSLPAAN